MHFYMSCFCAYICDMYVYVHTHTFSPFALFPHRQILYLGILTESKGENICIEANVLEHPLMRVNEITKASKILG